MAEWLPVDERILLVIANGRAQLYSQPALVFGGVLLALSLCARRWPLALRIFSPSLRTSAFLAWGSILAFFGVALWYLCVPAYFDHIEPSIAAISWLAVTGHPLYARSDDPAVYGLPYGPALYWQNGAAMQLLGPRIFASKVVAVHGALGSVAAVYWCARTLSNRSFVLGTTCAGYMAFGVMSFWVRAEPLLLAASALSIPLANRGRAVAVVGVGGLLAIACSVKITAILYFIPSLAILWKRGVLPPFVTVVVGVVGAVLAVQVLPNSDGSRYSEILLSTSSHGVRWRGVSTHLQWALIFAAPTLAAVHALTYKNVSPSDAFGKAPRVALVLAIAAMTPIALKIGAGPYHFLPFLPIVMCLECGSLHRDVLSGGLRSLAIGWLVSFLTIAVFQQAHFIGSLRPKARTGLAAEITSVMDNRQESVAVGYSSNYQASFLRPLPVFRGEAYLLDAPTLMDRQIARLPFPTAAIRALETCAVRTWLIPAGTAPFMLPNAYDPDLHVFPKQFVETFHRRYEYLRRGEHFDVWACRE